MLKDSKALHMHNISNTSQPTEVKTSKKSKSITSYRGFSSIDQEVEREIALQWFSTKKSTFSQRNFLLTKEKI